MRAILHQPAFNPAQMFVLQTLATAKDKQEKDELTSLYLNYVQQKMDMATDKWWQENSMTNEKLDEMLNSHHRTSSK